MEIRLKNVKYVAANIGLVNLLSSLYFRIKNSRFSEQANCTDRAVQFRSLPVVTLDYKVIWVFGGTFGNLYEFINVSQTVSAQNSMQIYNPVEVNFYQAACGTTFAASKFLHCLYSFDVIVICSKSKKIFKRRIAKLYLCTF